MNKTDFQKNNLAQASSLYLRQHAEDLVNWQIYAPETLEEAHKKNKLIFVSIGYSACHWCHQQQRESFQNEQIAALLNENFVSIKIDKEELPTVDNYFQKALQSFSNNGGWPVSAFLLPSSEIFFIGTYFPPHSSQNQIGFKDLLIQILDTQEKEQETISENVKKFKEALEFKMAPNKEIKFPGEFPPSEGILGAIKNLKDTVNGGYNEKPKFPQYAFYCWAVEQLMEQVVSQESADHIIFSINRMAESALVDQVRGGVHRYCVDETWTVPHFEKMLYDQAGFLKLMALTSSVQPTPLILDNILSTIDYLAKEMLSEDNFFFTSQDADSEGEEGLYYSFTLDEIKEILSKHELTKEIEQSFFDERFEATAEGNFHSGLNTIKLKPITDPEKVFEQNNWDQVRKIKTALRAERSFRIPPQTDNKGLANWNFLTISSLMDVYQYCPIDAIKDRAKDLIEKSFPAIQSTFLIKNENSLSIRHSSINTEVDYFIEDYVFGMESFYRSYEVFGEANDLEQANQIAETILEKFFFANDFFQCPEGTANNIQARFFDQSYKSAVSTLIFYLRKYSISNEKILKLKNKIESFIQDYPYIVLNSPIGFASGVQALCYPDQAFKVCRIPKNFISNAKFKNFRRVLTSRFIFVYDNSRNENDNWEICHQTECLHYGTGVDDFIKVFVSKE